MKLVGSITNKNNRTEFMSWNIFITEMEKEPFDYLKSNPLAVKEHYFVDILKFCLEKIHPHFDMIDFNELHNDVLNYLKEKYSIGSTISLNSVINITQKLILLRVSN